MKKLEKWKIIFICICLVFLVAVTADARRRTTSTSTPTPATAATATPIPAATVTPVSGATATPVSGGGGTEWVCGVYYAAGTVVTYLGNTYVALVGHTAYCGANWNPADTPSLWALSSSGGGGTVATSTPVQGNTATPVQANTATPVPAATATPTTPPSTGALWADEFNGSGLPAWNFDLGGGGWGNNELETYTNSTANCNQSGGYLNITALNSGGYTSSRIKSPYNRTYGRIEGRMKVPMGQGLWPAFWMLGTNIGSVGWPACGEIDIMEHINSEG
ncbi:MAG: family 16 glycosylhydrolase, partial [Spirochaetales bacterium]|nr:family 16 glycosylhydrolase [Spirochaetales bacterium]